MLSFKSLYFDTGVPFHLFDSWNKVTILNSSLTYLNFVCVDIILFIWGMFSPDLQEMF